MGFQGTRPCLSRNSLPLLLAFIGTRQSAQYTPRYGAPDTYLSCTMFKCWHLSLIPLTSRALPKSSTSLPQLSLPSSLLSCRCFWRSIQTDCSSHEASLIPLAGQHTLNT